MATNSIYGMIYDCNACMGRLRHSRGCGKRKRKAELSISCTCKGSKKCQICKGKGMFPIYQCPKTYTDFWTKRAVTYYYEYLNYGRYPDGGGRYTQPVKFLEALSIVDSVHDRNRKKDNE